MEEISSFNPNNAATDDGGIFGLPFSEKNAELLIMPIPWEATVSYRKGTSKSAEDVLEASKQVDLYDADAPNFWQKGYCMLPVDEHIANNNAAMRVKAEAIIKAWTEGKDPMQDEHLKHFIDEINSACNQLKTTIYDATLAHLQNGKQVALLGGDHSTPLGFLQAVGAHFGDFGILQIDAHADLRIAYEGFTYSHASIMYNVLQEVPQMKKLVQVGIRDYCDEELDIITSNPERVATFFDYQIKRRQFNGDNWKQICDDIINALPQQVYISFDIDGLDPKLCPNTGTPVPGGFEAEQIYYLFVQIIEKGKKIIAFDLNEVSVGEHPNGDSVDAMVGARVLYKMCNLMMKSKATK